MDASSRLNDNVHVMLVEPEKEGNIGSVARAIKNFGFKHLILVNPLVPLDDEAKNYAVHAADVLEGAEIVRFAEKDEKNKASVLKSLFKRFDVVAGTSCKIYKERTLHRIPIEVDAFMEDMSRIVDIGGRRILVVFGNERTGLPNYALNEIDQLVTIPTSDAYPSLNLSHAVTIILYELARLLATADTRGEIALASRQKRDVLLGYFDEMIGLTRTPKHKVEKTRRAFKSMVARSHVSRRELYLLLGVFRMTVDLARAGRDEAGDPAGSCGERPS